VASERERSGGGGEDATLQAASRRARAARVERGPAIRSAQAVESDVTTAFIKEVVPTAEPWLRKQILLREDRPTVAGILLFADEPQAVLPKHCGIKVYWYKTSEAEGLAKR
jgi:hypothetical protein